ncbi:MAG TPA: hypothetical protein VK738_08930 [Terriglobales bacterium]|nr:hypothetical protein [Terriglobales bacterium]
MNLFGKLNPIRQGAVLLLVLCGPGFASIASADSFDTPLENKVVDFGPSPYRPAENVRIKLSCSFYPTFMVKEYDEGEKGAEWLAIVPIEKGAAPECTKSHVQGERVIEPNEWSGYFMGVKGNLVFFDAADGWDGGMPFVIYDARTRKKIFEDSYFYAGMWNEKVFEDSVFNNMRVEPAPDGWPILKYLRVVGTECDIHSNKKSCWEPIRKKLGVKTTQKPVCTGYEEIERIHSWASSALAYPVEVSLFPKPTTKTIAGPVKCWPVD